MSMSSTRILEQWLQETIHKDTEENPKQPRKEGWIAALAFWG
jgi:hypothetical protein